MSWNQRWQYKIDGHPSRHTRESGYPEGFDFPGFRVALAVASLPGMTTDFFNGFQKDLTI
jgi:hypothetical protein